MTDAITLAKNYGYTIGSLNEQAAYFGTNAAADYVNNAPIFSFGGYAEQSANTDTFTYSNSYDAVDAEVGALIGRYQGAIDNVTNYQYTTAPYAPGTSTGVQTVMYQGQEVSKERMNEAMEIYNDKETTEQFDVLLDKIASIKEVLNSGEELYTNENGSNDDVSFVIDTIAGYSNAEYVAFQKYYKDKTGGKIETLIKKLGLNDELQGQMEAKAEEANKWLTSPVTEAKETAENKQAQLEKDVAKLYDATVAMIGTDEDAVGKILVGSGYTNQEIVQIMQLFEQRFGKNLLDVINSETSCGTQETFAGRLEAAMKNPTDSKTAKSEGEIAADASKLHQSMKGGLFGWGTDEKLFYETIFNGYSAEDLVKLMEYYEEQFGSSLKKDIEGDFSGHSLKALTAMLDNATETAKVEKEEEDEKDAE